MLISLSQLHCRWEEATLQVYEELKDVVMRPAMREVDELLALGVSVTVYNGQVSTKKLLATPQHF